MAVAYLPALLTLAGAYLVGAISPGPNFVLVTSQAALSRAGGLGVVLGFVLAVVTWSLLCLFGLRAVLAHFPVIHIGLRVVGSLYLALLGGRMMLASLRGAASPAGDGLRLSALAAARRGYLTSMTNPKAAAFFSSIFLSVIPGRAPAWVDVAAVAITGCISLCYYGSLALFFSQQRVQQSYLRHSRSLGFGSGGLLLGLGLSLALASQGG